MQTVRLADAKAHLSQLIELVEAGEEITITKRGKPVVRLVANAPAAVNSWTEVELLSALGIKVRTRQLIKPDASDVIDTYSRLVFPHLQHISVDDSDHLRALLLLDGWKTPRG